MLYDQILLDRLAAGVRGLLPAWGLPRDAEIELLTISENATYKITAADRALVVRVNRPGYHTKQQLLSELAWSEALRRDGVVTTPAAVPDSGGNLIQSFRDGDVTRYAAAFEFMSGKAPDAETDQLKWYGVLGETTARLHQHSRAWARPADFDRKRWDFDHLLGPAAYWGDWRRALGLTPDGKAILERAYARLERDTLAYGYGADRFGLIHCDMRTSNLLIENKRLGVIDFDDCGFCWFAYDYAASISFLEHQPYAPALQASWLDGYRRIAPFSAEHEAALPILTMLRRMQLTAWIASHSETPTAEAAGLSAYTDGTIMLAERYLAAA